MEKCRRMKRQLCVKELDTFLTLKVLENTPAVLSLGKLCDENGYSYEWINGQKPHLIKNDRGSRLVSEFFLQFSLFNINDTFKTGDQSSYIFLKLVLFTKLRQHHATVRLEKERIKQAPEGLELVWDRFPPSTCVKFTR